MKNILLLSFLFISMSIMTFGQGYNEERDYIRNVNEIPELNPTTSVSIEITPGVRTEIPSLHPPLHTPPVDTATERDGHRHIYWVHGFGGGVESWSKAADATTNGSGPSFPGRQAISFLPTYTSDQGLYEAQSDLKSFMLQFTAAEPETRNFVIGHSQGGVVSRAMVSEDHCISGNGNPQPYGGLVTFGSSLNGAELMNSRDDGKIQEVVEKTADIFFLPLAELIDDDEFFNVLFEINTVFDIESILVKLLVFKNQNPWIFNLASAVLQNEIIHNLVLNEVHDEIDESFVFKKLGELSKSIGSDYVVGSPTLTPINNCTPSEIDMIAFYGVEPYEQLPGIDFKNPIAYRTVQYSGKVPTDYETWEANNDTDLATAVQNVQEIFYGRSQYHQFQADYWEQYSSCGIVEYLQDPAECIVGTGNYHRARKLAVAFRLAAEWFENINDEWMGLIGATGVDETIVTNYSGFCDCIYDEDIDANVAEILQAVTSQQDCLDLEDDPQYAYLSDCKWRYGNFNSVQFDLFEKASDGVVLAESAKYLTGAQYPPIKMDNTSHMQMRNNSALKQALLDLYEGDTGSNFFRTLEK